MAGSTNSPKLVTSDRLDGIDRENFADMIASASFAMYWKRLVQELTRTANLCETLTDPPELYRAQGRASALRMATGLPEKMLEEMTKAQSAKR